MSRSLQNFCDKEVELDVYLPGTPHEVTKMYDLFPYHIWGKGTNLDAVNEANDRKSELRRREVVRRRDKPSCFEEACAYGNLQAVMLWWGQEAVDVPTRKAVYEGSDASGLMWAAFRGHLPVVRFLVDRGAPLAYETSRGHTALKWAIIGANLDVVRYLLDHGADPAHCDKQGHDAAFTAVQRSNLAALMMLSEDALEAKALTLRVEARPVIHVADAALINPVTRKPHFVLDVRRRDVSGQTLVHWAAYTNRTSVLQYLVEYWGADVNAKDKYGRTALVWAAREGFAEVVEYLLQVGADATIADADGLTAEKYAFTRNHPEALGVLRTFPKHGAVVGHRPPASDEEVPMLDFAEPHSPLKGATAVGVAEDFGGNVNGGRGSRSKIHTPTSTRVGALAVSCARFSLAFARKMVGLEYWSVRERRSASTFILIFKDRIFALMAIMGVLFMVATIIFTRTMPPVMSTFPFAAYFFKNMVTTLIVGQPEQGSVENSQSVAAKMGLPMSFAQSVRGTWRTRSREPANMFAVLFFIIFQAFCWAMVGNHCFLFHTKAWDGYPVGDFSAEFMSASTLVRKRDYDSYVGGSIMKLLGYKNAETSMGEIMFFTFWATIVFSALCKFTSRLSVIPREQEGNLHQSPMWRVLRSRCYKWLHPRLYLAERHTQIPVRAFYCPELDVVVRRYDGYSILVDCPIGEWNHVFFVLFITFFFVHECLFLVWGYTQMRLSMMSPVSGVEYYTCRGAPFYANALLPLKSTAGLQAAYDTNAMIHNYVNVTSAAQVAELEAMAVAPVSLLSWTWLNDVIRVLLHGLPCPHVAHQKELLEQYLKGPKTWAHYGLFLFYYYVLPSRVQMYSVWVLHYSAIAVVMLGVLLYRQYRAIVFRAATCMELANPLAPGSNGDLVLIFPPDVREAKVMQPYDADEEYFYELTDPSKARKEDDIRPGWQCIYGSRFFPLNALRFFTFTQGRAWKGAMSVSAFNQPEKRPMLT